MGAAHADSVEVIHQAFRRARRFARVGTFAEGLGVGAMTYALASNQERPTATAHTIGLAFSVIYAGYFAVFITRWVRFSKHREAEAIARFELHEPQPLYVQRRLIAYTVDKRKP